MYEKYLPYIAVFYLKPHVALENYRLWMAVLQYKELLLTSPEYAWGLQQKIGIKV